MNFLDIIVISLSSFDIGEVQSICLVLPRFDVKMAARFRDPEIGFRDPQFYPQSEDCKGPSHA